MRNCSLLLVILALVFSISAPAAEGTKDLLDAATLCPSPNNPLDGLKKLGGHLFADVNVSPSPDSPRSWITANVVRSLHSLNRAILTADRVVGSIKLEVYYAQNGHDRPLVCNLTVMQAR